MVVIVSVYTRKEKETGDNQITDFSENFTVARDTSTRYAITVF